MLPLRRLEIRRHAKTDGENDWLSAEGIQQAHQLGRSIRIGYTHLYSDGTQRATQTLACMLAGMGRFVQNGVEIRPGLRSAREEEWREAVRNADGSSIETVLAVNESLVREEAERLAAEIRAMLSLIAEGGYGLVITQGPLVECAMYGLHGQRRDQLAEACEGFLLLELKGGRLSCEGMTT